MISQPGYPPGATPKQKNAIRRERALLRKIVEQSDTLREYVVVDLIQELRSFLPDVIAGDKLVTICIDALVEVLTRPTEPLSVSDVVVTYTEALPLVCAQMAYYYSHVRKHEVAALAFQKLQRRFANLRFGHKPTSQEYARARFLFTAALLKRDRSLGIESASYDLANHDGDREYYVRLLLSLKHR
jgi:hypothetical protein